MAAGCLRPGATARQDPSLSLSPEGLRVCFAEHADGHQLRCATRESGGWRTEGVPFPPDLDDFSVTSAHGDVYFASSDFRTGTTTIHRGTRAGGLWTVETVAPVTGVARFLVGCDPGGGPRWVLSTSDALASSPVRFEAIHEHRSGRWARTAIAATDLPATILGLGTVLPRGDGLLLALWDTSSRIALAEFDGRSWTRYPQPALPAVGDVHLAASGSRTFLAMLDTAGRLRLGEIVDREYRELVVAEESALRLALAAGRERLHAAVTTPALTVIDFDLTGRELERRAFAGSVAISPTAMVSLGVDGDVAIAVRPDDDFGVEVHERTDGAWATSVIP